MMHRFITALTICTFFIHSINAHSFQEKDMELHNQDSLIISLQKELRTPTYKKEILPNDFSCLSHLITFGTTHNQPPTYLRSVVKMFSNMLKSSHYVNASAFSQLLKELPTQMMPYFTLPESRAYITNATLYNATFADRFKSTVQTMLYSKFSTEYDAFKQDPNLFLNNISSDIVTMAHEEVTQEQLRQSVIRFCEIALSKLIWDPATQEQTWTITKTVAEQLAKLLEYNILDDTNDLDDLHWTLLNRYCYFIELTATDMSELFFATVRDDIRTPDNIVLFALQEQDYIIEPKLSYMQRTLLEAETAAYCYRAGIHTTR